MPVLNETHVIDVMHIDDNARDLELTQSAFQDCCPDVAYSGQTSPVWAMADLAQRAADQLPLPALLVLDLNMPGTKGQDVLRFLRQHPALACLPVVVLTTSSWEPEAAECRQLGARDVFLKPITYEDLVATARAMLRHAACAQRSSASA